MLILILFPVMRVKGARISLSHTCISLLLSFFSLSFPYLTPKHVPFLAWSLAVAVFYIDIRGTNRQSRRLIQ